VLGRTHLQPAQPVLLAHHLLAYGWMALRDAERFRGVAASARRFCPLGAGALAGTGFRLPVEETAEALGFLAPYPNSIDAVSDRDFLAELLFACALTMAHLSRLAEELVLWSTPEFGTVALSEGFTTGSSMMPQKKNPDSAELIRGKAGAVFGELLALLVLLKGLPLAYMRDLQEDKPPVYRAVATTEACLVVMAGALGEATFRASEPPLGDFSLATELADWLVEQGLPFREAHRVVGGLVRLAEERVGTFVALTAEEFQKASPLFPEDVGPLLSPRRALERRAARGGTAPLRVAEQKEELRQAILRLRAEPRA